MVSVPGALEAPLALQRLAQAADCDALVALGAVIRGDTYHFEIVANESASGVASVQLEFGIPDRQRHSDDATPRSRPKRAPTPKASRRRRRRSSSRTCWTRSMRSRRSKRGGANERGGRSPGPKGASPRD